MKKILRLVYFCFIIMTISFGSNCDQTAAGYDILITNGKIVDENRLAWIGRKHRYYNEGQQSAHGMNCCQHDALLPRWVRNNILSP